MMVHDGTCRKPMFLAPCHLQVCKNNLAYKLSLIWQQCCCESSIPVTCILAGFDASSSFGDSSDNRSHGNRS